MFVSCILTDAFGCLSTPLSVLPDQVACPLAASHKSESPVALVDGIGSDPPASQLDGAVQDVEKVRAEDCWRGEGVDNMK